MLGMRRGLVLATVAGVVLFAASACAGGQDEVLLGGEWGEVCMPAEADEQAGTGDMITAGAEDLTITDVQLVEATNLELHEALVLPEEGALGYAPYPPADLPGWSQRAEAAGTVVPAGTKVSLVVAVSRPSADVDGFAKSLRVSYTAGEQTHERTNTTSIRVKTSCF